jgi:hypothetical protein
MGQPSGSAGIGEKVNWILAWESMQSVLWIRIGFNADPDPTFCLNADQDPGQTLKSQKLGF